LSDNKTEPKVVELRLPCSDRKSIELSQVVNHSTDSLIEQLECQRAILLACLDCPDFDECDSKMKDLIPYRKISLLRNAISDALQELKDPEFHRDPSRLRQLTETLETALEENTI